MALFSHLETTNELWVPGKGAVPDASTCYIVINAYRLHSRIQHIEGERNLPMCLTFHIR